jgi:coenzyme F420 hydrogenase subunit beta
VAATAEARRRRPELDAKLGLTVAVFCAGTPSTHGTLEMIRAVGADPERVTSVRYRGNGWPGLATIDEDTPDGPRRHQITYQESWGELLQMHRQWRCYVCMDHTGEFADVAVGDPWYRTLGDDEIGESLVLARTERGREAVEAAIADGYLVAEPAAADLLPRSQPNLLRDRGAVWARTTTTRVMGAPTPRYANLPGFRFWRSEGGLDAKARAQSFYGTVKRVFVKGLYSRRPVVAYDPSPERADHPTAS